MLAGLTGPLFTAGAVAGQVGTAESNSMRTLAVYPQTDFIAVRETNDALTGTIKKRQESPVGDRAQQQPLF